MSEEFDAQALMERVDDDVEFLKETVAMLDDDAPGLLAQIRAAAASEDAEALVKPAHTLKGMLSNFCAAPAEAAAREVEMMGRQRQLAMMAPAVEVLQSRTDQLREALHTFLRGKK
jgi:two-component system sensor histidine kinase/response regulator